ncbi:MAG TPA: NADH-quinone oxidoreductase subunit L [Polyangiaceae bacterium]|nr:NADH-quinone oxidoreductase subunit L [Polyangiaceae bacterium]
MAIPMLFGAGALVVRPRDPLRFAERVTGLSTLLAALVGGASAAKVPGGLDLVAGVVLLLVCALGAVVARYSRAYLSGDPGVHRYARFLLATLGAVTTLVMAQNLLVLAVAWTATSLSLHQLLTFYPDRPAALVAAHKKFIVSRVADAALFAAVALIGSVVGSVDLGRVLGWVESHPELPARLQAAAVLLVVAASLRSAQIPFHGWLTQVMEAPTPVSAILHAGVVNLGGFLMIRLSPFMARAELAQLFLVVVGTSTAVVAGLVASTRVSVKVALAWSTCAQTGFMLAECGIGAWDLALLHLVAHSLYKAHAFLSSGERVDAWRASSHGRALVRPVSFSDLALGTATAAALVLGLSRLSAFTLGEDPTRGPAGLASAVLLVLSLGPLLADGKRLARPPLFLRLAFRAAGFGAVYLFVHSVARAHLPPPAEPGLTGALVLSSGFAIQFALQAVVRARPDGAFARSVHPLLSSGLWLDERFTRVAFRLWPPHLPAHRPRACPITAPEIVEV